MFFDSFASFSQASSVIRFVIRTQKERIEKRKNGTEYDESKGRQRRRRKKTDNSRQGQAVFKCGCCCFCLLPRRTYARQHFYRLVAEEPSHVSIFLPFSSFILENSTLVSSALSNTCRALERKKEREEKRKKADTSVPFRVHHQALLLIVGKYSGTVTRGEFLEAGVPLCLARNTTCRYCGHNFRFARLSANARLKVTATLDSHHRPKRSSSFFRFVEGTNEDKRVQRGKMSTPMIGKGCASSSIFID